MEEKLPKMAKTTIKILHEKKKSQSFFLEEISGFHIQNSKALIFFNRESNSLKIEKGLQAKLMTYIKTMAFSLKRSRR